MKKASIVIINYNDKLRVSRAIESALGQTWQEKEVIVVDDGSNSEVLEIYEKYLDKIHLIGLERKDSTARTPSRARNAGIRAATGAYICFLDSDNYYEKTFVEDLIKEDKDVVFCNWSIIGLQNYNVDIEKVWNFSIPVLNNYLQHTHLDHQCLLIKKSYLDKVGIYDERLPRSQDCDMIVRLILGEGSWHHVGKRLFVFEKHEEDQMKYIASIYGKTLWTLKNNIHIKWIIPRLRDEYTILAYHKAINDFMCLEKWEREYENSEFKTILNKFNNELSSQLKEKEWLQKDSESRV